MKIDISKDETGEWLDVVFAVSVGLGSTSSQENVFLQRELATALQSCGAPGTLCLLGIAPGDGAELFSITLSVRPNPNPDLTSWAGKTDSFIVVFPCFLLLLISKDSFSPTTIRNTGFVYLVSNCVRNE